MKITIAGAGYVGLSLSVLLSQNYTVKCFDIDQNKVDLINNKIAPFKDKYIEDFLKNRKLDLEASTDKEKTFNDADFAVIATPTNYDIKTGSFNTSQVDQVIEDILEINPKITIVIKSTVPFGYTEKTKLKYGISNIFFSPEFLREGNALYDNLFPSRIIIGDNSVSAKKFGKMLLDCSEEYKSNEKLEFMTSKEAEAVKLFSNSYLAMRIAFFNELDSFSEIQKLSSEKIISGVSADPRIGNYYNNPSFGYGGYCLPKDTKQLLHNFSDVPNNLIKAIVESNQTRKEFIINSIMEKDPKTVGVYRLIMKSDSDNFRDSAIIDIIHMLKKKKVRVYLYEPLLSENIIDGVNNLKDFQEFLSLSDLVIANRISEEIIQTDKLKLYSRDIFNEN